MATLIKIVVAVFVGVMLGLLVTIRSLDQANRSVTAGPWHRAPHEGVGEIDPYALAADARAGLLPLGASEGLSFVADADTRGGALVGRCDYAVTGTIPSARFWTLTLLTPEGFPIADPASRFGFTSSEVLRVEGEPILITVSAKARSGNWLPIGRADRFVMMLRLYDTGLSTVGTVLGASGVPSIRRLGCR